MTKKDSGISQVHEFLVVGPDVHGETCESEDENTSSQSASNNASERPDEQFTGPRKWVAKWFGPFFNVSGLPARSQTGLYLIYVGNYPLFVSSSANTVAALSRHIIFSGHQVIPIDLLGREILHYANIYHQQLTIKTALLFEENKVIHPKEHIYCYRRAAAALAFSHSMPCNKYARAAYEFDTLSLENLGKSFPLCESIFAEKQEV